MDGYKDSEFIWHGLIDFQHARTIQLDSRDAILAGRSPGSVILCEHPKTLSAGTRTAEEHLPSDLTAWCERGGVFVRSDRGGSVTLHLPGQLVIYPSFSLRFLGMGVKTFVSRGLEAIALCAQQMGVTDARMKLDPAGVWIADRKIASVGLRIQQGITMHGFSLNVCCELSEFSSFSPCGMESCAVTSLVEEGVKNLDNLGSLFVRSWRDSFLSS
jgi:lipoate-protein ligase B